MLDGFGTISICLEGSDFLEETISGEPTTYNGFLLPLKPVLYSPMFNILSVAFVTGGASVLSKCLLTSALDCRTNKGEFIPLILVPGTFVSANTFDPLFCIGVEIVVVV